jgi:hypothetical protein
MKPIAAIAAALTLTAGWFAAAQPTPTPTETAVSELLAARDAIDAALAVLNTTTTTPAKPAGGSAKNTTSTSTSSTTSTTSSSTSTTSSTTSTTSSSTTSSTTTTAAPIAQPDSTGWVDPPIVAVPVLQPGTEPIIPIPGTNLRVRFVLPIQARPPGSGKAPNMQVAYEHATATGSPLPNDPLVSPGNGSHDHDFAGIVLPDVLPDLSTIHQRTPVGDPASHAALNGIEHWLNGFGHQPGVWHPTVYFADTGQPLTIGAGSALNYVRDPAAHLATDRLVLLPNGCGYVTFVSRYENTGDGKYRVTWDGPTWARKSLLDCSTIDTPTENHDAYWFDRARPPWADTDGIPLAKLSFYFKSGDLKVDKWPNGKPALLFGSSTDMGITPHLDYVSSSSPITALDGIQFGQWLLDMTVNAHLFGGDAPLYGRWRLETQ